MSVMSALVAARDALAALDGVVSCKIGVESAISPAEYPMIRLIPTRITPGRPYSARTIETTIVIGWPTAEAESGDLEQVYTDVLALESSVRDVVSQTLGGRYIDTVTDGDEIAAYKLLNLRCELTG